MTPITRINLFIVFFSTCLIVYLAVPVLYPFSGWLQWFEFFEDTTTNFIFLMISFLAVSFVLSTVFYGLYTTLKGESIHAPKIGEILVSEGIISQEQLKEALELQKLKIGEILVHGGRITASQRDQALAVQNKKYHRIGEILKELGYSTEEDIRWALNKMNAKIGNILKEKKLITDYDITCAISVKNYHIDSDGKLTL